MSNNENQQLFTFNSFFVADAQSLRQRSLHGRRKKEKKFGYRKLGEVNTYQNNTPISFADPFARFGFLRAYANISFRKGHILDAIRLHVHHCYPIGFDLCHLGAHIGVQEGLLSQRYPLSLCFRGLNEAIRALRALTTTASRARGRASGLGNGRGKHGGRRRRSEGRRLSRARKMCEMLGWPRSRWRGKRKKKVPKKERAMFLLMTNDLN